MRLLSMVCLLLCLSTTYSGLAPSLKSRPPLVNKPEVAPEDIVRFTKNVYKELGNSWNNTDAVIDKYRPQFQELNQTSSGQLGQTLTSLLEIRMLDLQASVRHARKMRSVFQEFMKNPAVSEPI
jgi:hypothetical protein